MADEATFAFTDIEGSTTRWERDRVAMQDAVRRHDAVVQAAIAQRGGHVFKTAGDAFYSVFAAPQDAVTAMLAAQRALGAEDFSAVDGLRVRASIHTSAADMRGSDYFGPALNKVARVLAIGHGGQVLLTAETVALVDGTLPADVTLRDLGAYHLKDIDGPQRLYQLLAPGLRSNFPPLRSLGTLPSDLSVFDATEFHAVPSFSGRDEELATLQAALRNDGAIAVVHGLGGVGKSSIAREYGWRDREHYSAVWWLNAQTEDGIIEGLLRLGLMFVAGLDQLADRRVAAERVLNSVLSGFDKPVLLVFDNLEDEGLMRTWLPRTGARALATSRGTAWSADITAIPLQIWTLETAMAYLHRASRRADLSDDDARAIAQAVGALPLALAHAAASLRSARMVSPQRYLERISERLHNAPHGAEYPRSVFATFGAAIAQAEQQAPGAAAMLCFAASFAPDAIPDELFRQGVEYYAEALQPTIADELLVDEALGALDRLSLLSFAPSSQTYGMHRLVQLAALDLEGKGARAWRECAVCVADIAFPAKIDVARWPQCERLLSHARAALDALSKDSAFLPAGRLAFRCACYLRERGEYAAAEVVAKRGLATQERALGSDHPDVARSLNNLGIVYHDEARYADEEPLHMRAVVIREKALGPDDLQIAFSLTNLANLYQLQERYADAEPLNLRSLAIREKALGPDHSHVAMSLNILALMCASQGRYAEAESHHRRALAIREKAFGPDGPDVGQSLNNLADLYCLQGRYADAEPLLTRALSIRERALGPDHPEFAESLSNLANVYRGQGRYGEAEPLLLRVLAIREKSLGPDHPSTKAARDALGALRS